MPNYAKDLARGLAHLDGMRAEYLRRKGYYDGEIPEAFGSVKLRRALRETMKRYRLTFAAVPVDSIMGKVKLASMTTSDDGLKDVLASIIDENELEEDLDFWLKKAAYFGDYYALVEPTVTDGEDGPTATGATITGKSPLSTAIIYQTADTRRVAFGIQRWTRADGRVRVNLYYDGETYQLVTKRKTSKGTKAKEFEPLREVDLDPTSETYGEELEPSIPNPDGFPLFHFRVDDKPYGLPVHRRAFGPQDAITKLVATHMGSVDFMGFPQRYALANPDKDPEGEMDDAGEDFGDGEESQDDPTSDGSKLKSGPGELWWLRGIKEVGQFDTAEAKNFIEPMLFYIRSMGKLTGTPLYEFDLDGAEPSGESRRRADAPQNDHADKLKRSFEATISSMLEHALDVVGHADKVVTVSWKPAEVVTDAESWATVSTKVKNGVPLRVALLETGYSPEQVEEWYPEKGGPAVSADLASTLAEALAKLGQASAAGMASPADAAAWFPGFLVGPRPEPASAAPVEPVEPVAPADPDEPLEATEPSAADDAAATKAKADALGALVRAGATFESAAAEVGLSSLESSGAVPTTLRLPAEEADELEDAGGI